MSPDEVDDIEAWFQHWASVQSGGDAMPKQQAADAAQRLIAELRRTWDRLEDTAMDLRIAWDREEEE